MKEKFFLYEIKTRQKIIKEKKIRKQHSNRKYVINFKKENIYIDIYMYT